METEEGHVEDGPRDAMANRGGCLKLGWGCLPVVLAFLALPGAWWLG